MGELSAGRERRALEGRAVGGEFAAGLLVEIEKVEKETVLFLPESITADNNPPAGDLTLSRSFTGEGDGDRHLGKGRNKAVHQARKTRLSNGDLFTVTFQLYLSLFLLHHIYYSIIYLLRQGHELNQRKST